MLFIVGECILNVLVVMVIELFGVYVWLFIGLQVGVIIIGIYGNVKIIDVMLGWL